MRFVVLLVLAGCKFSHDKPHVEIDAPGDDEPIVDTPPDAPLGQIRPIAIGDVPDGAPVSIEGVITAVTPDGVYMSDRIEAVTDPTFIAIRAVGLRDEQATHELGVYEAGAAWGDLVTVHAHAGRVMGTPVLVDGYIRYSVAKARTPVPTIPVATLATIEALAPYEAMLVHLETVPIAPNLPGLAVKGGGRIDQVAGTQPAAGTCAMSITGVVVPDSTTIQTRIAEDVQAGAVTTGCPDFGPEADRTTCHDAIDNNWDGIVDCAQTYTCGAICLVDDPNAPSTTITALQTADPLPAGFHKLHDAIVMATGADHELWVGDPGATGWYGGMHVRYTGTELGALAIGTRVDIAGQLADNKTTYNANNVTERVMLGNTWVNVGAAGAPRAPAMTSATEMTFVTDEWEGQLVHLTNHRLTSGFNAGGYGVISDGTSSVLLSTYFGALSVVPGTCFSSIEGIVIGRCGNRPATDACIVVAPRSSGDLVEGTGCP